MQPSKPVQLKSDPPAQTKSRCIICRSRPEDGEDGWCGHCLTSYLDGWMPPELLQRVYCLWGLKNVGNDEA